MNLEQFSLEQGFRHTGQFSHRNFILKDDNAKKIFLKVAKEAEEKFISDTVAAQYLVSNHKEFEHLSYNTVRRYFKDYRYGLFR
tara:strand:- start:608 stop:859 length:252 start_codon:yes stop_codon:yes gene_type:complete